MDLLEMPHNTNHNHDEKYNDHAHDCTDDGLLGRISILWWLWCLLNWEQLAGKCLCRAIVKSVEIFPDQCCQSKDQE